MYPPCANTTTIHHQHTDSPCPDPDGALAFLTSLGFYVFLVFLVFLAFQMFLA